MLKFSFVICSVSSRKFTPLKKGWTVVELSRDLEGHVEGEKWSACVHVKICTFIERKQIKEPNQHNLLVLLQGVLGLKTDRGVPPDPQNPDPI